MTARIAITGMSVLSPLGDSVAAFAAALRGGTSAVELDAELGLHVARLRDFDAARYATVRGMRVYPRASQLEICAAIMALNDASLAPTGALDPLQLGLITASGFSHLETLIEYDRGLTSIGMQRTNPTLMPLGLPSAPCAATGLSINAKAFAITLNDGGAAGLAAIGQGLKLVAAGRANVCVVAGAITLCRELLQSAEKAGILGRGEAPRVLSEGSRGTALGEGAAAIVLESAAQAEGRGRAPLGYVSAPSSTFAPSEGQLPAALARACRDTLGRAGVAPGQVALVSSDANGVPAGDRARAQALLEVFVAQGGRDRAAGGDGAAAVGGSGSAVAGHGGNLGDPHVASVAGSGPVVTALKGHVGELLDVSGILQCIAALSALRERVAPPIVRLERPVVPGLRYAVTATDLAAGPALLTAAASSGACSALLVST
jgi:3-oxoacyl-[acyl-carrier-protein] synthase II